MMLLDTFMEIIERDGRLPSSSQINTAARKDVSHGQEEEGQVLTMRALEVPRDGRRLPRRDWDDLA